MIFIRGSLRSAMGIRPHAPTWLMRRTRCAILGPESYANLKIIISRGEAPSFTRLEGENPNHGVSVTQG